MAGKKGRSGRRPMEVEAKRFKSIDKAWRIIHKALTTDDKISLSRLEIAKMLVGRDVSRHQEHAIVPVEYLSHIPLPNTEGQGLSVGHSDGIPNDKLHGLHTSLGKPDGKS